MKYAKRWEMPEVTFYEVTDHAFEGMGDSLYAYGKPDDTDRHGVPITGELYPALDRALVAWVAEKYTGPRGAGGTGVGTAADWFMKMIGADQLVPAGYAETQNAIQSALSDTLPKTSPIWRGARAFETELNKRGLILARMNTP